MSEAVERDVKRDLGRAFRWLPCSRCGATTSRRDEYDDGSVLCRNRDACDARAGLTRKPTAAEKAAAIELGLAWQAAEAALPEGGELDYVGSRSIETSEDEHWMAQAYVPGPVSWPTAYGATPAEALRNLVAKLNP